MAGFELKTVVRPGSTTRGIKSCEKQYQNLVDRHRVTLVTNHPTLAVRDEVIINHASLRGHIVACIKIMDLGVLEDLSKNETKGIFGGEADVVGTD